MILVPNSFGVRLREFNPNHQPAGSPDGGEFAPKRAWHLTDDPHFTPDPNRKPDLNRVFLSDLLADPKTLPSGLFVTDSPEYWMQAHGYERPYVAEVEGVPAKPMAGAARVGHEEFLQGKMRTVRVLPIDEYSREKFGEPGWVESYLAPQGFDAQRKRMPKGYVGRSVSEMSPAEIKDWERKFAAWTKRSR